MNMIGFNFLKNNKMVLRPIVESPLKDKVFKDYNVLITGGGTGLGKMMATVYSKLGANVTIASRKENVLKQSADEISNITGNNVGYKILNLREHDSITSMVNEFEKTPDIVVNNAAGNFICRSHDLSYNGWNSILDIVLKGSVDLTLQLGKRMIEEKKPGVFCNISTTYANTGSGFVLPSAIAKAGCDNMTKSLAAEWGKYGIRIENLYVTKIINKNLKLKNVTLVPYDLELINWRLITKFEKIYIKQYHKKIFQCLKTRLNYNQKNYFIKNLINKI